MVSSKTKVLTVRLPNEHAEVIIRTAKIHETTPSQLMARVLADWLREHVNYKEEKRK